MGNDPPTLARRSRVVAGDRYVLTLHVPNNLTIRSATIDGKAADITRAGTTTRIAFLPPATGSVRWSIEFERSGT